MRIFNIVIIVMMVNHCGNVNKVAAAVDSSYQSQVITGFYGEYVFSETDEQSNAQPNEPFSESLSRLPTTGDQQTVLSFAGLLLIIASLTRGVQVIKKTRRNQ